MLGSGTELLYFITFAFWTFINHFSCSSAVVTFHDISLYMVGHGNVAPLAPYNITAFFAGHETGIASFIEKQYYLLILLKGIPNALV